VLIYSDELLEMGAFLDGRDQGQLLEVVLEYLLPLIYQAIGAGGGDGGLLDASDELLSEVDGGLRELDVRVLVDELLVEETERLVLLAYYPFLLVEGHLDHVLGVLPVVEGVIVYPCGLNGEGEWDLEEEGASIAVVLAAGFDMLDEDLGREEHRAELALHALRVLEHPLVKLNLT